MSAAQRLLAMGFQNPVGDERIRILRAFVAKSNLILPPTSTISEEFRQEYITGGHFTFRGNGKVCRFLQLSADEIIRRFNNGTGLQAVLRATPARIICDNAISVMDILYSSDGCVVICSPDGSDTAPASPEVPHSIVDPAVELCNTLPRLVAETQHVPRPPNA